MPFPPFPPKKGPWWAYMQGQTLLHMNASVISCGEAALLSYQTRMCMLPPVQLITHVLIPLSLCLLPSAVLRAACHMLLSSIAVVVTTGGAQWGATSPRGPRRSGIVGYSKRGAKRRAPCRHQAGLARALGLPASLGSQADLHQRSAPTDSPPPSPGPAACPAEAQLPA